MRGTGQRCCNVSFGMGRKSQGLHGKLPTSTKHVYMYTLIQKWMCRCRCLCKICNTRIWRILRHSCSGLHTYQMQLGSLVWYSSELSFTGAEGLLCHQFLERSCGRCPGLLDCRPHGPHEACLQNSWLMPWEHSTAAKKIVLVR